jgi:hypothetical protein
MKKPIKNNTIYPKRNKVIRIFPSVNNTNKFIEEISNILIDIDLAYNKDQYTKSEFKYNFKYCLYYATNSKDVKFEEDTTHIIANIDKGLPSQELSKYSMGSILIENNYIYKGYKTIHSDLLLGDKFNIYFNDYAIKTYNILGKIIFSVNENLENPDFIDFNKHSVLIITVTKN